MLNCLIYIICLFVVFGLFFCLSDLRYKYKGGYYFAVMLTPLLLSIVVTTFSLISLSDNLDANIQDMFPEEYSVYLTNENNLSDYEILNEKGMLSETGKDKVLKLTEENNRLYSKLDDKLKDSDSYKKYKIERPNVIKSTVTSVYVPYVIIVVVVHEVILHFQRKKELRSFIKNNS